jgi:hypothetical protein
VIIKPYGELPRVYAPDIGEIIYARRTPADKLTRAVVLDARRNRDGHLRVKLQWLESNPDAGSGDPRFNEPIRAGSYGWVVIKQDATPPLIVQIDGGAPSDG